MLYAGSDYFAKSPEELLTVVMLETAESARNAQEILSTPGIDACFIGPNDLSVTLGFPSGLVELPAPVEEAIGTILKAAQATGKAAGIQAPRTANYTRSGSRGHSHSRRHCRPCVTSRETLEAGKGGAQRE